MKEGDKRRISSGTKQRKPAENTARKVVKQTAPPVRGENKRESLATRIVKGNEVVESVNTLEEESQMEEQIIETVSSYGDSMSADEEKPRAATVPDIMNGNVSDLETNEADGNGDREDEGGLEIRAEALVNRIAKLEEELRHVAALEISLYSVVPEHGSSEHKVHTPARRLSRLYFHAYNQWSQHRCGSTAKSIASGIVLIAKSCGNDVSRLTFWLSNVVVLREIISEALSNSHPSRTKGSVKQNGFKQNNPDTLFVDDWQETGTFTTALEKIESWIFSRIVESVWWQSLTPHMQPPSKNSSVKNSGKLLAHHQQGNFSVNLWISAFQDAAQRLCPVRGAGHECGCSPLIAKMVMEASVARLDVAMFNAILRESANETPTDPVSDPIIDARVLPIPAGNLSFGSGAQLKNSVGNWSRWLSGMNRDDDCCKYFRLLSDLSDLLMLPKDMLMDRHVRQEVCPSIGLLLIKRILCNFTPDEFCPDPVPGAVLESLNAECVREGGHVEESFPYAAFPIVYTPRANTGAGGVKSFLRRNASSLQRKGYTSDEELDELTSPLTSIIENASSPASQNGNVINCHSGTGFMNSRYELLRQVWSE